MRFALAEKGLDWGSRHIDLFAFENWSPDYVAINPRGVVPALVNGEDVITESNVIIEYLEDEFPSPALRPRSSVDRARMRAWMLGIDEVAHPSVVEVSYNLRHRPRLARFDHAELVALAERHPDPDLREAWLRRVRDGVSAEQEALCYRRLDRLAARWNECLEKSAWLAGESFSLADIAVAPYVNRISVLAHPEFIDSGTRPHLARWWDRIRSRPAYGVAFDFTPPEETAADRAPGEFSPPQ